MPLAGVALAVAGLLGAGSASAQVVVDGETIPADRMVYYLFIGHSNMAGRATPPDKKTHPRAWKWDFRRNGWVRAKAPIRADKHNRGDRGGPGMPFLKRMVELYPEHHFGIMQNAYSSNSIQRDYLRGRGRYKEIVDAARRAKKHGTLGGVVAMLGFLEAGDRDAAKSFTDDCKTMMAQFRADLDAPELPLLIGRYEMGAKRVNPFRKSVHEQILNLPKVLDHCAVIDSEGPYADSHHYNVEGLGKWAHAAAGIIKKNDWVRGGPGVYVKLTQPKTGQQIPAGKPTAVTFELSGKTDKVARVELTVDGKPVARDTSNPYKLTLPGLAEGVHELSVRAILKEDSAKPVTAPVVRVRVGDVKRIDMVVGSAGLDPGERAVAERLRGRGIWVQVRQDEQTAPEDLADASAVMICASCNGFTVRKLAELPQPVIIWNDYCPELRIASRGGGAVASGRSAVMVPALKHPLTAGLRGKVTVTTQKDRFRYVRPGGQAIIAATLDADPAKAAIVGYEAGARMARAGATAPARRVGLFLSAESASHFTDDGWKLLDAAVDWAMAGDRSSDAASGATVVDAWPGSQEQLVFLWDTAATENRVAKRDGKGSQACKLSYEGQATLGCWQDMEVTGGAFVADDQAEPIVAACRASDAVALECRITPGQVDLAKPAHIVTLSQDASARDLTLYQQGDRVIVKLRTDRTNAGGIQVTIGKVEAGTAHHVAVSYRSGELLAWLDGKRTVRTTGLKGNLDRWSDKAQLRFGAEAEGKHDWRGRIEAVAIYARTLDDDEVAATHKLLAKSRGNRSAPPRVVLEGKLLLKTPPPEPLDQYRRSLVIYEYKPTKVVSGKLGKADKLPGKILVAHWAVLDGQARREIVDRRIGQSYRLTVEPKSAHKQLGRTQVFTDSEEYDLPVWVDVDK